MNQKKIPAILAFCAAICFLIVYFIGHQVINLILGCAWGCIGCLYLVKPSNKDK